MREVTGNLFDYEGEAIGHGVNCKGAMGAGIAAVFRDKYPKMHESYKIHCESGALVPGGAFVYRAPDGKLVANLASQDFPGADASYTWLAAAAVNATSTLLKANIRELALPQIGCGIGGLDWEAVKVILKLLETVWETNGEPFEFVIYTLEES